MVCITRRAGTVLVAGALLVAGCGDTNGQQPDGEPDPATVNEPEEDTEGEPEPEPEPEDEDRSEPPDEATGNLEENPGGADSGIDNGHIRSMERQVGDAAALENWEVTVVSVDPDAEAEILSQSDWAEPALAHQRYVMFRVDATHIGGHRRGYIYHDIEWGIVGSRGSLFTEWCSDFPDRLVDHDQDSGNFEVSGNLCIVVDLDEVEGATIYIEDPYAPDPTVAWYPVD